MRGRFWSSVDLTGNQTAHNIRRATCLFWSSVDLTGNQTGYSCLPILSMFWSSVDLTGNQTQHGPQRAARGFGAVSI